MAILFFVPIDVFTWLALAIFGYGAFEWSKLAEIKKLRGKHQKPFFIWKLEFSDVFRQKGGFDVMIGNPPYLKERGNKEVFEPVNDSKLGLEWHQGKMDYWFYFLHLSIDLTNLKSLVSFITPRYWINSTGATKLISRVQNTLCIKEVLDIGKLKVFDDVVGHHMVAFYGKDHNSPHTLHKKCFNDLSDITSRKSTNNLQVSQLKYEEIFEGKEINFNTKIKIKACDIVELGNICDISQGVVEGTDKVGKKHIENNLTQEDLGTGIFLLTEQELLQLKLDVSEMTYIRSYIDSHSVRKYHIDNKIKHLIYLNKYNCPNIQKLPNIRNHLSKFRSIMEGRRETIKGSNLWFHLHWPRKESYFTKSKIVFKGMFDRPGFSIDTTGLFFGMSMISISKPNEDYGICLESILAILNSKFAEYWFNTYGKKRGIGVDIGVAKLKSFPIKKPTPQQNEKLKILVDQIYQITTKNNYSCKNAPGELVDLESQIDELVFELYDLSEDERNLVFESYSKQ